MAKFNEGDKVLGPQTSRGLPLYTIIQAFHSPDGKSIYKAVAGDGSEPPDPQNERLFPEELLSVYDPREGRYFESINQIYVIRGGKPQRVELATMYPLIVELLNAHHKV